MPAFDGTGPRGQGPMTGRGLGPCGRGLGLGVGYRRGFGAGAGAGRGLGRGRGLAGYYGFSQPADPKQQKQALSDYRKALEEELEDVKKEISEE